MEMTIKELIQLIWADIKAYLSSNYQPKGSYASSDHNHNSAYLGISAKAESAKSADSVTWGGVSGRPTAVSQFTNDSGYITGAGSCNYANSAGSAPANGGNADTIDGYHEYSFLRDRGGTSTPGESTLWAQIGIKEYYDALPDGLSGVYRYGETVSLAGSNVRFDIYCSHLSSDGDGLYYRSGWVDDKKTWRRFIDSANIGSQSVNYASYAARSSGDGAFYISGYQIYVG